MKILFVHPNMPGQFKHLCRKFAENPDNTVVFITKPRPGVAIPGVHKVEYVPPREPSHETHRYLVGVERSVIVGQEVYRICKKLKHEHGFIPDVVVSHPGWGDTMFIKDIYPDVPLLSLFEFYYNSHGADVNFVPDDPSSEDDCARIRTKNMTNLMALETADWGVCPTHWQRQQHKEFFWQKLSVLHDGVDTETCHPVTEGSITLRDSVTLTKDDEIITYIARNFEPYRGFPTFMRAAEKILKERPNAHIIAVGGDDVSYGKRPPDGTTYREILMKEVNFCDPSRIYFVGRLPYNHLIQLIQISSAHLYLTYPFVLSWSMLEAMACGALVIGSNTPPVEEVIRDGQNGLIVDFFSADAVAERVTEVLEHPTRMQHIREAARQTIVDQYALSKLIPLHMSLVSDLAKGELPPSTAATIDAMYTDVPELKLKRA